VVAVASPDAGPSAPFTMAEMRQPIRSFGSEAKSAKLGPVASPTARKLAVAPDREMR